MLNNTFSARVGRLKVVGENRLKIPEYADSTEAVFLDIVQTKVVRVSLLAIHSHLYSFALRFLFLQTHATSYSFIVLIYTVRK